jgi:hypothetical protein
MTTPHEFRVKAEECVRLALQASEHDRPLLIELADNWMRLAAQAEIAQKLVAEDP